MSSKKDSSIEPVDSGFCESFESANEGIRTLTLDDKESSKVCHSEFQWNCSALSNEESSEKKNGYDFPQDEDGDSCLHLAIANGNEALASQIISVASIMSINAQNSIGQSPLMIAVLVQMIPIVRKLIDTGADLGLCDKDGNNIIHLAAGNGIDSSLKEIFTLSSQTDDARPSAIYSILLESRNGEGYTPFHLAIKANFFDTAYMLKHIGSDVNAMDYKTGFTPLHHIVQTGNVWHVQNFIDEFEPIIDPQSYAGITPLHLTVGGSNLCEVAEILIVNGAATEMETPDGLSWSHAFLREERLKMLDCAS